MELGQTKTRSLTLTLNPDLPDDAVKGMFDKIGCLEGVQQVEWNGLQVGELMALGETEPQWMQLMHKMLDVMMRYGQRPDAVTPQSPPTEASQSTGANEQEYAQAWLFDYLQDGPQPEPQIWAAAAAVNPPLTIKSVMDASVALSVSASYQQDQQHRSILCWGLNRKP